MAIEEVETEVRIRWCSAYSPVCLAKNTAAATLHAYLCGIQALAHMQLMPGLTDLCSWLDEQRIPRCLAMQVSVAGPVTIANQHNVRCRGLITRNSQASVNFFHANHLNSQSFLPALCRDFEPYKPSPAALLHICQQWQISPTECMMVGDSAKDDVSISLPDPVACLCFSLFVLAISA